MNTHGYKITVSVFLTLSVSYIQARTRCVKGKVVVSLLIRWSDIIVIIKNVTGKTAPYPVTFRTRFSN